MAPTVTTDGQTVQYCERSLRFMSKYTKAILAFCIIITIRNVYMKCARTCRIFYGFKHGHI